MKTWYQIYKLSQINKEADTKQNMLLLLMILSIVGFDMKFVDFISKKYRVPKEELMRDINKENMEAVKNVVQNKETDSTSNKLCQTAIQEAKIIKEEIQKMDVKPQPDVKIDKKGNIVIDDKLVKAILSLEGSGVKEISYAGAVGRMQIMPATWEYVNKKYYAGKYPFNQFKYNENINLMFGKKYLEHLSGWLETHKSQWKSDPYLLLFVCYNAGPGNVFKMGFDENKIKKNLPSAYDYAIRGKNLISA